MNTRTLGLGEDLHRYVLAKSLREPAAMRRLREASDALPQANMRSSAEQVQLLQWLARLIGARRVIEVGMFTGYGTLGMALGIPADGRVVTLDRTEEFLPEERRAAWEQCGVLDRIELRLGDALESLQALRADGGEGRFDLAFVDADKPNYPAYFEHCLALMRPGGVIAVDNVLWSGRVADPDDRSEDTVGIRALNDALVDDERIDLSLLPIGDGLTLARKR